MEKVNLAEKFAKFSEHWSPKLVGQIDNYDIKLAKIQGEFVWHQHAEGDEMFLVVDGVLTIRLRDRAIELKAGEIFVVPKGVEHMPVAEDECQILMLERKDVVNTGNAVSEHTVTELESL